MCFTHHCKTVAISGVISALLWLDLCGRLWSSVGRKDCSKTWQRDLGYGKGLQDEWEHGTTLVMEGGEEQLEKRQPSFKPAINSTKDVYSTSRLNISWFLWKEHVGSSLPPSGQITLQCPALHTGQPLTWGYQHLGGFGDQALPKSSWSHRVYSWMAARCTCPDLKQLGLGSAEVKVSSPGSSSGKVNQKDAPPPLSMGSAVGGRKDTPPRHVEVPLLSWTSVFLCRPFHIARRAGMSTSV